MPEQELETLQEAEIVDPVEEKGDLDLIVEEEPAFTLFGMQDT
jgi:hypothetical protein